MPRKKETLTLSVPPGTKAKLEELARRLKIFWGKSPSPSGLVAAIANQTLEVGQPFTLVPNQVKALQQAIKDLTDAGHIEEAQSVLALLIERGQLEAPLRQALLQQVSRSSEGWRILADQYIANKQPFHLVYRNAQQQELEYTVRFAEPRFYEKRFYLQIWCEETVDAEAEMADLPELRHNRCLRLDRIQAILPVSGEWRERFDSVEVQLHLRRGLIKAYESKLEDLSDRTIRETGGETRQIIRRVENSFWFLREVSRYGEDCVVIAPESLRRRMRERIAKMQEMYDDREILT